ncbi:MAG: DeoD-type purine-nucleoside phosphorylase [Christensenella sp.]
METSRLTPTQHNYAKKGEIAETVLMPGDPKRAQYIAENFLSGATLVNDIRLMYAYTGMYKGRRVSIMAHGMGGPSIAIYAHELYAYYGVENIIRIGTAGALFKEAAMGSLIAVSGACYNTNYAAQFKLDGVFSAVASYSVLSNLVEVARSHGIQCQPGLVLSSDIYYQYDPESDERWVKFGVLAVEMETAALYLEAARNGKKAGSLLTITGNLITGEYLTPGRNNRVYDNMIRIALDAAIGLTPSEGRQADEELHSWRVAAVADYISTHLSNPITIDELCALTGTSRSHLSMVFKEETGYSITQYVNRRRVEISCGMLRTTNVPVIEIALSCGFDDQSYFNRVFRKVKGVSPTKYRKDKMQI